MALALGSNGSTGIAFLVSGGIVYEIIAFSCSSPQTAEINIRKREDTLMKWVHIGQGLSAVFIGVAVIMDRKHAGPILAGGVFAMVSTEFLYMHAATSGKKKPGPETEEY
jgi:hypothetical protein